VGWHLAIQIFLIGITQKSHLKQPGQDLPGGGGISPCFVLCDERLVLDLLRGRVRSIGGDLDDGEADSEQTIVTLQLLHHGSIGYQHMCTRVSLAKKAMFLRMQLNDYT
jgi:hypothetical protein